ncbi:hypothetical protein N9Q24_02485 [Flavobacteriaceae bacterium]|nr:hypothetical protein [Flavobacteriaceae bacterium]
MKKIILTIVTMVALTFSINAQNNAVGIWEGETIRNGDISNNLSYAFSEDRTGSKIVTVMNHKTNDISQKAYDFTYSFSNDFIVLLYKKTADSDTYTFKRYSSMITLDGKEYKK